MARSNLAVVTVETRGEMDEESWMERLTDDDFESDKLSWYYEESVNGKATVGLKERETERDNSVCCFCFYG